MEVIVEYSEQNKKSKEVWERAQSFLPAGNTRTALYWPPFPIYNEKGRASHVWDVNGKERIDFNYNNTTLILGHNHPKVVQAVKEQLANGTVLGAPTEPEVGLAEELTRRLRGADKIRFTPSGSEANMQAVMLARAYTGKPLIAKCVGAYHGCWDAVPLTPDAKGIPQKVKDCTVYFPYNDSVEALDTIKKNKDELAAVIIEPTMRDMTPKPGFLEAVREATEKFGILLIFDEVISFRLSSRGAQHLYGVIPDITTMGKIIGGGFPVGAYAATKEIMKPMEIPRVELSETASPAIGFSGTFNAHPITMAAGLAAMKEMKPPVYERLSKFGETIREGLRKTLLDEGVKAYVGGLGSLFFVSWTDKKVNDHETSKTADQTLFHIFNLGMMNEGVFILRHPNVSAVQTNEDLKKGLDAARNVIIKIRPFIKKRFQYLLT